MRVVKIEETKDFRQETIERQSKIIKALAKANFEIIKSIIGDEENGK